MELGILTLGEHLADPVTGATTTPLERMAEIVDLAVTADRAGFGGFAIGEHHSPHYLVSTPPVVLAAVAARTERIRIRSAVTLVVNLDPVRIAEDYATLDLLSEGRLDLIVGKGIYPEPFELFGPDPADLEAVYVERLDLLLRLLRETDVSWEGASRAPLHDVTTRPRPLQEPFPIGVALGRSPSSAELAAERGLPVMLGGAAYGPANYKGLIDRYREVWTESGRDLETTQVAATSHCHVAPTSQEAKRRWEPHYRHYFESMAGLANIQLPPIDFAERTGADGPAMCGSPSEVIDKMMMFHELYEHDIHFLQVDLGGLPSPLVRESVELLATEVLPEVQRALASSARSPAL